MSKRNVVIINSLDVLCEVEKERSNLFHYLMHKKQTSRLTLKVGHAPDPMIPSSHVTDTTLY